MEYQYEVARLSHAKKSRICRVCGLEKYVVKSTSCTKLIDGIKCEGKFRVKVEGKRNIKKLGELND